MLTVEALRAFGANVDEGIARCVGNEEFYLRMVNMALDMDTYDALEAAVEAGDLQAAYEAAHSLKGVLGNVSLGPLSEEAAQISDLLKAGTYAGEAMDQAMEAFRKALLEAPPWQK